MNKVISKLVKNPISWFVAFLLIAVLNIAWNYITLNNCSETPTHTWGCISMSGRNTALSNQSQTTIFTKDGGSSMNFVYAVKSVHVVPGYSMWVICANGCGTIIPAGDFTLKKGDYYVLLTWTRLESSGLTLEVAK